MVTNALSPMRVIETFQDCVESTGTIGVMSSGQGSVANNTNGGHEVYRGSKAALNSYMRSYDARHRGEQRTLILMAPGWVKTDLGGPDARLRNRGEHPGRSQGDRQPGGPARTSLRRLPRADSPVVGANSAALEG